MRTLTITAMAATLMLTGCGANDNAGNGTAAVKGAASGGEPVKRQPGSWSQAVEIVRLEGKDVQPGAREQMQQMFSMVSAMTICVTPELAAEESLAKNLEQASGGANECSFDQQDLSGSNVKFSGICKSDSGQSVRMSATGTAAATAQDITMVVEPLGASGEPEGVMEMRITAKRNGECTATDITPPAPGAAG